AIDRTEVTIGDYDACVKASACKPAQIASYRKAEEHPKEPVRNVTWTQADAYCRHVKKRLPTEAEWERAARGTDLRSRAGGDGRAPGERPQIVSCPGHGPMDVGQRPQGASPDGVLDLVGNVKEWVADGFTKTYYLESPLVDPKGPSQSIHRTVRGSSYMT